MLNNYFPTHQLKYLSALVKSFATWFALLLLVQLGSGQTPLNVWSSNGPNAEISSVVADPINPNIIYAGSAHSGIFKSTNNGASWSSFNEGIGNLEITRIAIDPGDPNILYAGTSAGLFKTSNGAAMWSRISVPAGYVDALGIAPSDPRIVYAASYANIIVTMDGGDTWNNRILPDPQFLVD